MELWHNRQIMSLASSDNPSNGSFSNGSWPFSSQIVLPLSFVIVPQENYIADIFLFMMSVFRRQLRVSSFMAIFVDLCRLLLLVEPGIMSYIRLSFRFSVCVLHCTEVGGSFLFHGKRYMQFVVSSLLQLPLFTLIEVVTSRAMILLITAWRREFIKNSQLPIVRSRTGWVSGITGLCRSYSVHVASQRFASANLGGSHLYCHVCS